MAGGLLTNTNQNVAFLRMLARGASIDIDGVYSNPAGLAFLPHNGLYLSLNGQSAYQTRLIDATSTLFPEGTRHYKGKASAPIIPSLQAAYKTGQWTFSGSFAVVGGGGKASFDTGLPMFDTMAMGMLNSALSQHPVLGPIIAGGTPATNFYTMNSALDGKQYIYGVQLGITYKINPWLSAFVGGRMNYFTGGYEGFLTANLKEEYVPQGQSGTLTNIALDCDQTGWGITPILGLDAKFGPLNIGLKYEFMANMNIENKTKTFQVPPGTEGAFAAFADGVNTPNDIPALLTAAVGYEFLPTLRASVEYHYFFDKSAGMAGDKQKALTGGTNEYLAGIEWDVHKYVSISGGFQKTDYGLSDDFQSDTSFSCDSYSIGLGAALNLTSRLRLNLAYFWTTYSDYTKKADPAKNVLSNNVYGRTNKVFGLGIDYRF
jgi:long-chain fatty acid transport protein